MRHVCLILVTLYFYSLTGCSKQESSSEIKINKSNIPVETAKKNTEENSEEQSSLQKITSKEVKLHVGDSLIIKGYIADIYLGEKVAYLNFENKFPKNIFSCAIFSGKFGEFGDLSDYKNKNVEVYGRISVFKGKPQVILNSVKQIKIIR